MKKEEENKEKKQEKKKKVKDEYDYKRVSFKDPILLSIIGLILVGIIIFAYNVNLKVTNIAEYTSPNNEYTITFKQKGEAMIAGPTKVKATLKDNENKEINTAIISIRNNAKEINGENITVNWLEEYVEITVRGEDQNEKTQTMYYKEPEIEE